VCILADCRYRDNAKNLMPKVTRRQDVARIAEPYCLTADYLEISDCKLLLNSISSCFRDIVP